MAITTICTIILLLLLFSFHLLILWRVSDHSHSHVPHRQTPAVSPTDGRGPPGPSPGKALTPEEPKRPDSLLGRFERREHLKKANTLPSSVTGRKPDERRREMFSCAPVIFIHTSYIFHDGAWCVESLSSKGL